ncbi:MAG: hypothetical protein QOI74_2527 [Micromonosporaceae bacterium]|jgi:hypothetical protein|nr:hypothetical protein [Micromonosporaceae bacterium]
MFVQIIQGRVADRDGLRGRLDLWVSELSGAAAGWLGSTGGVTADGTGIALARFESEQAARRNSDRPEQGRWWADTEKLFTGDVMFHDSTDVTLLHGGGSDRAGFVQVIQGRVSDVDRARALMSGMEEPLRQLRPDVIGGEMCWHGDDRFTQAMYFTSAAAAREGEGRQPSAEVLATLREYQSLSRDVVYHDLTDPWLHSPA